MSAQDQCFANGTMAAGWPLKRMATLGIVILLGVSYMFNSMDRQVFPALLGTIIPRYGLTRPQAGFVGAVFTVMVAIFGALSGWFMDRFGRKPVLVGGLIAYSGFTLVTPLANGFGSLAAYRTLTGAGEALQVGDLIANRRLALVLIGIAVAALFMAALSSQPSTYLLAAVLIGLSSVAVQVLVPFAAHLAPEHVRGRVVGIVMSGLMIGIMLARPPGSSPKSRPDTPFSTPRRLGMAVVAVALRFWLPPRVPVSRTSYATLLKSMGLPALRTRILQRRALYQAYSSARSAASGRLCRLLLTGPTFGMAQGRLALFALVGLPGQSLLLLRGAWPTTGLRDPRRRLLSLPSASPFLRTHQRSDGSTFHPGLSGGWGDPPRFRHDRKSDARPEGDLRPRGGVSQSPQRALHGGFLRRRRSRFQPRRLGLHERGLGNGISGGSRVQASRVGPVSDRVRSAQRMSAID